MRRQKMSRQASKRNFRKNTGVNKMNSLTLPPQRGGRRL